MTRPSRSRFTARPKPTAFRAELLEDRTVPTAGAFDTTFGTGGIATLNSIFAERPDAIALLTNGEIGVTGADTQFNLFPIPPTTYSMQGRVFADGSPDDLYGSSAIATGPTAGFSGIHASVLLPNGQSLHVGTKTVNSATQFGVFRANADGTLDTTFGTNGATTTSFTGATTSGTRLALDAGGNIVFGGTVGFGSSASLGVARLTPNGKLDPSFATGGQGTFSTGVLFALDVSPSDGSVVVLGGDNAGTAALARLTPVGKLDPSFGANGMVTFKAGDALFPAAVGVRADGSIVLAAQVGAFGGTAMLAARFTQTGAPDATFGTGGSTMVAFGKAFTQVVDVDVRPDGKVLLAGSSGGTKFAVARLTAAGQEDPTFGNGGYREFAVNNSNQTARAIFVQPDGKILIAGQAALTIPGSTSVDAGIALVRLQGDTVLPSVVVTPGTAPAAATAGTSYSLAFAATGTTGAVTYTVTDGVLPAGLTLDAATGVLSGTPTSTAPGLYGFAVTATDSLGQAGRQAYTLGVNPAPVAIAPAAIPDAAQGIKYGPVTFTAPGPFGPAGTYTFTMPSYQFTPAGTGSFAFGPTDGFSLAADGVLTGRPDAPGTFTFTVRAHNTTTAVPDASRSYTIHVGDNPIALTPPKFQLLGGSHNDLHVGKPYDIALTATGPAGHYAITIVGGALPAGMSLQQNPASNNAHVIGAPTATGSYNFQAAATDADGNFTYSTYTGQVVPAGVLVVNPAPNWAHPEQTSVGQFFGRFGLVSGIEGTLTRQLASGGLPSGVTLDTSSTNDSVGFGGIVTAEGRYVGTITLTDTAGNTASIPFDVVVGPGVLAAPEFLAPDPVDLAPAAVGAAYSDGVLAEGFPRPTFSAVGLPTWATIDPATGEITGTPTAAGSFAVTITAANGVVPDATLHANLVVTDGTPPPPPASPPTSPPAVSPPVSPPSVSPPSSPTAALPPPVSPPPALHQPFAVGTNGVVSFLESDGTPRFIFEPFPGFHGEIRTAAGDFNGDGADDLVLATGPGGPGLVRVLDGRDLHELLTLSPFEATFTGGAFIAAGDVTGDGRADLVVSAGESGGPRVRVFDGTDFRTAADFFGIDDTEFRGGARVAVGDLDGDGVGDLIVAAGMGGGPRVAAFNGRSLGSTPVRLFADFLAFEPGLRNGTYVAGGDVNGDGRADLIAGGGPGGGPRVSVFDGLDLLANVQTRATDFFAADVSSRGGARVAVKNLDGDSRADLVIGAGTGAGSGVTAYAGNALAGGSPHELFAFDAFPGITGGVFVG